MPKGVPKARPQGKESTTARKKGNKSNGTQLQATGHKEEGEQEKWGTKAKRNKGKWGTRAKGHKEKEGKGLKKVKGHKDKETQGQRDTRAKGR